jgi:hypothetical protein
MNTFQQRYEVLSSSRAGMEFEFYSELSAGKVAKSLSKALGKKVILPVVVTQLDTKEKGTYHSAIEPTSTLFKLEKDFSGGKDMYEMITGPLDYEEARIIIIKMLSWIKENGWTNDKCAIHLNVSFDYFKSKLKTSLMNLNVLKFALGFDESFIYQRFPRRKDSVYAKSIYNIYPVNRFVFYDTPESIDKNDYVTPHEKYYGVNFTKLPKDYLELRYLGGEGYERKTYSILEVLDYFVSKLYSSLQQSEIYTPEEKSKLYSILKEQKKAVMAFNDPVDFLMAYPDLRVTVDMRGEIEILKAYWTRIREKLFDLVVDSGLRKGHFNYDTDFSANQLRDGVMKKANDVDHMELFDCEISGTIRDSQLFRCKINSSRFERCKLMEANEVKNSKIEFTTIFPGNEMTNCYINNRDETIEGKIMGGVIRKGILGKDVEISKETLIVDVKGAEKKDYESYMDLYKNKPEK